MFKKYSTVILIALIFQSFFCLSAFAQTASGGDSKRIIDIKNTVAKVGIESSRKIKVKLADGTKLKGYVTEVKSDKFSMLDEKTAKIVSVEYAQVAEAKSGNLPKSVRVAGYTALATGVVLGILVVLGFALKNVD